MQPDFGAIMGMVMFGLFGVIIAFVVPKMIQREARDEADAESNALPVLWLRILGLVLLAVAILVAVVLFVLD